jgi:hypothetical protein
MPLQSNVNVELRYGAETTFGTQSSADGQVLRRVSSSLALTKDVFSSNEVRPDQQVADLRHGVKRAGGQINGELSKGTYDDFIAAALRSTWATNEVVNGVLKPSFTIEQVYPDLDTSEVYLGMRVGEMSVSMPPTGMATITFGFQGKDMTTASLASSPVFATPTVATTTSTMSGVNGSMNIDGVGSTIVTGLDFSLTNNLNSQPVVGSTTVPEIFYGRSIVTGNVSAFFDSVTLLNAFINESIVKLAVTLTGTDSTSLTFKMNKVKLTGAGKSIGADGGVIVSFPFQALLATGIAGDANGTLVVERSA